MKKIVKLYIEVEKDIHWAGMRGKIEIFDMLFSDYERVFDYDSLKDTLKEALKMLKGFGRLTMQVSIKDDTLVANDKEEIIGAYRLLQDSSKDITISVANSDNVFRVWNIANTKSINIRLKELVDLGNKKFIELVKENNETNKGNVH